MTHLTEEESRLVEPLLKKYKAIATAAGDTLAEVMSTEKHVKDVRKVEKIIGFTCLGGAVAGYFLDVNWLLYLSLGVMFFNTMSNYAYAKVMQEKIERLFDKVDILMIDWIVEFGDDKHIRETFPKAHIVPAGAGYRFDTCTKAFDLWWSYHCRDVYRRVLGRERANELCELETADIEKAWEQ